jgi:hypothetical protein
MKRFLTLALVVLAAMSMSAQWTTPRDVPAYNAEAPKKGTRQKPILPVLMRTGPSFQHAYQKKSYEVAEKNAEVLHQQPCYCYCDRGFGHNSLRSCFETDHGAHCAACMKEAFYTAKMLKQKKTPAQIREGIIRGEWQSIDLEKAAFEN